MACSGLWLARISSSWSASPVSTAGSGAVCACVPRLWVRSASCSRSVARRAVGADAFLAELGREVAVFEGFEVALQLRFQPADVGAGGGELFFEAGPFGLGVAGDVGERLFDEVAVAVEVGELGEDGCFEAFLGQPVAGAFGGAVLVAGGAGVVGLAAASAVRLANQAAVVRPSADESSTRRGDGPRPRISGRAVRPPRPLGQL